MNSQEIALPRKLTNQLLHLAQASPDSEICGLIGADSNGKPVNCYPIDNSAEMPSSRFLLDAGQQIAAMRKMRERGESLFAIYHSHPDAPAVPSNTDIEQASYPDVLHLIISLSTKGVLEMRGFEIADRRARELTLTLVET